MANPKKKDRLIEVAVGLPVEGTFTYAAPAEFVDAAVPGMRVLVPFGRRQVTGYVLGPGKPVEGAAIKEILEVLDDTPSFTPDLLRDLLWIAEYYMAPPGEVLRGALPAGIEVTSTAALVLTDAGREALADKSTSESDRDLLARIAAEPGISVKKLATTSKIPGAARTADRFVRKGWAVRQQRVGKASVSAKSAKLVVVNEKVADMDAIIEAMRESAPARARVLAYVASEGAALQSRLSKLFKGASGHIAKLREGGFVTISETRVWRDPALGEVREGDREPPSPTDDQRKALDKILRAVDRGRFSSFLLHGVTGSGKTEVYLRAIAHVLDQGRQALVLVPEIGLTPQLVGRFRARFGSDVAVLHSGLGRGERLDEWTRVRQGRVRVAVGARSAVFAPFDRLGLVVVDEEHDGSYKQDDKVRYNARDFAVVRARGSNAVVLLGSATPSFESRRNALDGRYGLLELPRRVHDRPMPEVEIVDMREEKETRSEFFSASLDEAVQANLDVGKQTLLFLNRRGFAPFLMCVECGYTFGCPHCAATTTYHQGEKSIRCHLCDWSSRSPNQCPGCRGSKIKAFGAGTERIEDEVRRMYPTARVARMDRDTAGRKGAIAKILKSLRDGSIDILVGTQMIAKGHDYPGVTLVGALLAETSLNIPDFRAAEVTFSLLAQVAGRAGRGDDPGRVIVQTFNPGHYAIRAAVNHDYNGFAEQEDTLRRDLFYPPWSRLVAIKFESRDGIAVRDAAEEAGRLARRVKGVDVLGPAPSPWSRIRERFRWQLLIKGIASRIVRKAAAYAYRGIVGKYGDVKVVVDVDPMSLL